MEKSGIAKSGGELIQRIKDGDDASFSAFVSDNWEKVFSRAYSLLNNKEDAEEVAQDTFIKAKKSLDSFRGDCSITTWLYLITTNLARNKYWYWWRRKRHTSDSLSMTLTEDASMTLADVIQSDAQSPAEDAQYNEISDLIPRAMALLEPMYADILRLRNEENLSYEEIAAKLDITVGTVKSRISRAREFLRTKLSTLGLE